MIYARPAKLFISPCKSFLWINNFTWAEVWVFICHCHERASAYWLDRKGELWNNQRRKKIALSRGKLRLFILNGEIMKESLGKFTSMSCLQWFSLLLPGVCRSIHQLHLNYVLRCLVWQYRMLSRNHSNGPQRGVLQKQMQRYNTSWVLQGWVCVYRMDRSKSKARYFSGRRQRQLNWLNPL